MDAGELGSRNMSVTWLEVPAGIDHELHSHEEAEQVYIVVSGRGTMTVAGDTQEVAEGDLVLVPPATDHSIANGNSADLCCVSVQSPPVTSSEVFGPTGVAVFFRDSTRRRAESAGAAGWVRNTPNGAVEAVFEGDPVAVAEMVEFCRRGPSRAEVVSVEVEDEEPEGLSGFEVR
jgi:acylphosphatase